MGNTNNGCYCSRKQTENEICYSHKNRNFSCDNIIYLPKKVNLIQLQNKNINDTTINESYDSINDNKNKKPNHSKHKSTSLKSKASTSSTLSKQKPLSNNNNPNIKLMQHTNISNNYPFSPIKPKTKPNPNSNNQYPSLIGLSSLLEKKINNLLIKKS